VSGQLRVAGGLPQDVAEVLNVKAADDACQTVSRRFGQKLSDLCTARAVPLTELNKGRACAGTGRAQRNLVAYCLRQSSLTEE